MHWMYFGYLIALGIASGTFEAMVHALRGNLMYFHGWIGWILPPCSVVVGGELWLLASIAPAQRRRWKRSIARAGKPSWYGFFVGSVTGASIGSWIGIASGFDLYPGLWIIFGLTFLGPIPAVAWVYSLKPDRSPRPDYDDQMSDSFPTNTFDLLDLSVTEAFGRRLGQLLFPNAVVALIGPLGAGKTHLTRAVAEGLGIANPAAVTSPTFTLIHEYPARLPIFHFDAYRLNGPNEFLDLGVSEYYESGGVCLIEWADKVEAALPVERLTIRLMPVDENRRRAEVVGAGERYEALARGIIMSDHQ
jgi:tRNA threonylcarbamoyladenosine biosynthesis protein TsaE